MNSPNGGPISLSSSQERKGKEGEEAKQQGRGATKEEKERGGGEWREKGKKKVMRKNKRGTRGQEDMFSQEDV